MIIYSSATIFISTHFLCCVIYIYLYTYIYDVYLHIYIHIPLTFNVFRWNAACMIQRNFRVRLRRIMENNNNSINLHIYNSNSSYMQKGKIMMKKLKNSMQNSIKRSIYLDRLEACTMITDFLVKMKKQVFKSALRLYIR